MVEKPRKEKKTLERRHIMRTYLALDFIDGSTLTARELKGRYYAGLSDSSFHKTFKRDRDELEKAGIRVCETKDGQAKRWKIDASSLAGNLSEELDEYSRITGTLARTLMRDPASSNPKALGPAIARASLSTGAGSAASAPAQDGFDANCLPTITEALRIRKPVLVNYQAKGDKAPQKRLFKPYGLFSTAGYVFVVGMRSKAGEADAMRTYNLSRVHGAQIEEDEPTFTVDHDFRLENYQFLPFEIGEGESTKAWFRIPQKRAKTAPDVTQRADRPGSERISRQGGAVDWSCYIHDVGAAARWAVENGLYPFEPPELVEEWKSLVGKARQK